MSQLTQAHFDALAARYMDEDPDVSFKEYIETICYYCSDTRQLLDFITGEECTLQSFVHDSPAKLCQTWQDADKHARRRIVIEVRLLLLKVRAEASEDGYREVREKAAAMMGIGVRGRRYSAKKRHRIIGAHFAATQGKNRGSFIGVVVAEKGEEILSELSAHYSAIAGTSVSAEQLLAEANAS